jgi:IS6 family transposase
MAGEGAAVKRRRRSAPSVKSLSAFVGFRFPPEVILLAVRWYLWFGLSYRDLEELLAERGIYVDHVILYRWVQRFTPLLVDVARPCRRVVGSRWFVDETYVKVAGVWRYVYSAVDDQGQVIDVLVSQRRDIAAARAFFAKAVLAHSEPDEVVTDRAAALAHVVAELVPDVRHNTAQYANNRVECDHGRLNARLRPMRGLMTDRTERRQPSWCAASNRAALVRAVESRGVDAAIECSGALAPIEAAIEVLNHGGVAAVVGIAPLGGSASFDVGALFRGRLS